MSAKVERAFLQDALLQLRKYKELAEKAVAQIDDAAFFGSLDRESNSIALNMKHMAGNMRSRWTDFLTADGEKPDREREREFIIEDGDTRDHVMELWEDGWRRTIGAIQGLEPDDVLRIVTIRAEPHTVMEAINRQLTHYSYHVGQIVLLAKHCAGDGFQSLSIPRGGSGQIDVSKSGSTYGVSGHKSRPGN